MKLVSTEGLESFISKVTSLHCFSNLHPGTSLYFYSMECYQPVTFSFVSFNFLQTSLDSVWHICNKCLTMLSERSRTSDLLVFIAKGPMGNEAPESPMYLMAVAE